MAKLQAGLTRMAAAGEVAPELLARLQKPYGRGDARTCNLLEAMAEAVDTLAPASPAVITIDGDPAEFPPAPTQVSIDDAPPIDVVLVQGDAEAEAESATDAPDTRPKPNRRGR